MLYFNSYNPTQILFGEGKTYKIDNQILANEEIMATYKRMEY